MAQKAKTTARKKRVKKNIASGVAHVHSTFNNTIVTITDEAGNVIAWSSAGALVQRHHAHPRQSQATLHQWNHGQVSWYALRCHTI